MVENTRTGERYAMLDKSLASGPLSRAFHPLDENQTVETSVISQLFEGWMRADMKKRASASTRRQGLR
jgi:hypothetical protein